MLPENIQFRHTGPNGKTETGLTRSRSEIHNYSDKTKSTFISSQALTLWSSASEVNLVVDRINEIADDPNQVVGNCQKWGLSRYWNVVRHLLCKLTQLSQADVVYFFILELSWDFLYKKKRSV